MVCSIFHIVANAPVLLHVNIKWNVMHLPVFPSLVCAAHPVMHLWWRVLRGDDVAAKYAHSFEAFSNQMPHILIIRGFQS